MKGKILYDKILGNISVGTVRLWLILWICALASICDIIEFTLKFESHKFLIVAGLAAYSVLKATFLTAIYILCRRRRILKPLAIALIAGFIFLSLVNGICWIFFGFGITNKLITIIIETNPREISEFLPELKDKFISLFLSIPFYAALAGIAALWILLPKIKKSVTFWFATSLSIAGLVYILYVFIFCEVGKTNHLIYARGLKYTVVTIRDAAEMRALSEKRRPLPDAATARSEYRAERLVVVIGESAAADHLSIYGYPLPTSPRLDSLASDLFVFSDAVASSSSTADNIPRILSFMTDEPSDQEWYDYPTILQLFKKLGYTTSWISNQERTGKWSNISGILAFDADRVEYLGSMNSEDQYLFKYDDVVIPAWQQIAKTPGRRDLTFIHLMGSHFQYDRRYPPARARFHADDIISLFPREWLSRKKAEMVANYDNSILYTDSILSLIIRDVKKDPQPAALVYFSDHGENVYDDRDYRGRDPKFTHVPFIVFVNDAYRNQNPEIVADLQRTLAVPFSTSELPQMLLHLSGSDYSYYDPKHDPLSPSFRRRTRYVDGEPYFGDNK